MGGMGRMSSSSSRPNRKLCLPSLKKKEASSQKKKRKVKKEALSPRRIAPNRLPARPRPPPPPSPPKCREAHRVRTGAVLAVSMDFSLGRSREIMDPMERHAMVLHFFTRLAAASDGFHHCYTGGHALACIRCSSLSRSRTQETT